MLQSSIYPLTHVMPTGQDLSQTFGYSTMDWTTSTDPEIQSFTKYLDTPAYGSNRTGFNVITYLDFNAVEGQGPASFTHPPSVALAPHISLLQRSLSSLTENNLHNQFYNALREAPSHSQGPAAFPQTSTASSTTSYSDFLEQDYLGEPSRSKFLRQKRYREEEEFELEERLDQFRLRYGSSHPATLDTMSRLGQIFQEQDRLHNAESSFKEVAESCRHKFGEDNLRTIEAFLSLATILLEQSNLAPAERLCRRLQTKVSSLRPPQHVLNLGIKNELEKCLYQLGRVQEAEEIHAESVRLGRNILEPDDDLLLWPMEILAGLLEQRGDFAEAKRLLLAILDTRGGEGSRKDLSNLANR